MIWLYIILFSLFSIYCFFGFFVRWQWNKNFQTKADFFPVDEISVIIPFRNELENLPALIESINQLKRFPREIIWVNDHSEDDGEKCLELLNVPVKSTIIHLAPGDEGKKIALRAGISQAFGDYILTWDADIVIHPDYFTELSKIPCCELLLMPVSMPGQNLKQLFFELDYQYLNALNTSISGHSAPIVASGANLLFNKTVFEEIDSFEDHADIASGDDIFLLQDFKLEKKTIELAFHNALIVKTKAPERWDDFFQQRLRWIGKSKKVGDRTANIYGIIGLLYHVGFWMMFITDASWKQLLFLTIFKIALDAFLFVPYLFIIKRSWVAAFMPIFSLVYPIYMLMIMVMTLFYEPEWKGRNV